MPKPFRLFSTRPLPPDAELVEHDGRPHLRLKERGRSILCPLTKDGKGYLKPSKCWYFKYRDANGIVRRRKGFSDLKATEQLAIETERRVARQRLGYADPAEEHATRPLADHLADYAAYLEAKGDTSTHVTLTVSRIRAVLDGCEFVFPRDLDAHTVSAWLTTLRRDGTPVALPDRAEFTPAEVADLLGITGAALRAAVKRLNLPVTGNGKARRFPRATVEALALTRAKGVSPETVNHYVRALRGFGRWLVKSKRIGSNPLETLSLLNAAVDVRRRRRELDADELRRLLEATRTSNRTFRGLTGLDRYCLYLTAVSTGLRAGALANLTPENFDLTSPSPLVTVPARFSKNRKTHTVPLPSDVAAELRSYLAQKAAGRPIWDGTWGERTTGARRCSDAI
jgi:integrase